MDDREMDELEDQFRRKKAERNYNFFRPVGQFIEHVDTINFSMDKDGTFHFENIGQVISDVPKQPQEKGQVAACFEEGVMNQEKPHLLFMMLLVLRAKRKWTGQEIPAFYDWVKENYPNLEDYYGKTRDQIVWNMQKLSERATHYFYDKVKDQASMTDYIDEVYAKKKDGERRKECIDAQSLAQKLFERL